MRFNQPANIVEEKRRQTIPSKAARSGVKSTQQTSIDDVFYKPHVASKMDYLHLKEDKLKKDIASIGGGGTITNDSMIQQIQNLDISTESKKFLSSRHGPHEDVNLEQFGFEQFVLGQ